MGYSMALFLVSNPECKSINSLVKLCLVIIIVHAILNGDKPVEVGPGKYIIINQAKGYSKVQEFYSPQYKNSTLATNEPDLRTTLLEP